MTRTTFLRPVHAWFFVWEQAIPAIYRVVATGLAAGITVGVLAVVGVVPFLAAVVSLPAWIGLAIAQEHDERVLLPPDPEFTEALKAATSQRPLRLRMDHASGPSRARRGTTDHFLLSTDAVGDHPLVGRLVEIERDEAEGWMSVEVFSDATSNSDEPVAQRLQMSGARALADRVLRTEAPSADADAIANALRVAYW